jgi:drug/metabolite transporter (DMT)-like permease
MGEAALTRHALATAAAAATGVQVGSAMVATRVVVEQTGPASLALLRYAIGVLVLLPAVLLAVRPRFAARDVVPIALLGSLQFGVLITLLNYGLRFIPSARAALIFATVPLLAMLLAVVLGHERLTGVRTAGVLLTIAGVGFAFGEKALRSGHDPHGWLGEIAVFGAALSGAACSVLYRPYVRRYPAVPVSAFAMLASVAFLAVPAAREGFFDAWPRFTGAGWAAVGFIGFSSGVGYFLWLWALGNAPATQVTVFLAVSPFTAALLGALLLAEPVTLPALAGLVCVALGLWLAHREEPG